ncbi:MAG: sugar transferase [Cyanobacteria bacterium P01_G01_bin.39]
MTSPANLHRGNIRILPSRVERRVHPSVVSKAKRMLDILGAIIGLALTVIIAIPVAIVMQFDDPGTVFYSQIRCGFDGKPFRIWKFRSMITNADQKQHLVKNKATGHIFKNDDDPRITRVGHFLRRTSLDEFPQFWNVLKGDMSLVGTRPPTIAEVAMYEEHHFERLKVKPGITGEWQVKGRSEVLDFEDIVRMDLNYQQQWSFFYDLDLLIRTVAVVLARKGAC